MANANDRWSAIPSVFGEFLGMAVSRAGAMWVADSTPPYSLLRIGVNGRTDRYYVDFAPFEMVIGADGALYVGSYGLVARVETGGGKAVRGLYVVHYLPGGGDASGSLALASDGNVWFTEGAVAQEYVAKIATDGTITEYTVVGA